MESCVRSPPCTLTCTYRLLDPQSGRSEYISRQTGEAMHPEIQLTRDGRLLRSRSVSTPHGPQETVSDVTLEAQHWLDEYVALQAGTCLSAVFELLKANASLREVYKRNWVQAYLERYEAIRRGEITPNLREDDAVEPSIEAVEVSLRQELTLPHQLPSIVVGAQDPNSPTATTYLDLIDGHSEHSNISSPKAFTATDCFRRWDVTGRSVPFTQDTECFGVRYTAGSHINYSISGAFDRCIDLPLRIGPGALTLTIRGKRRKDRLTVCVPLGSDPDTLPITLHELVGAITEDFSFYGAPEASEAEMQKLRKIVEEMEDPSRAEDMTYGMAHLFCPDAKPSTLQACGRSLEDRTRFWSYPMVAEHTGWTEAEIEARQRQGRLLRLRAMATGNTPDREAFPCEQFIPGFDVELLRFLNWIASMSCSDWAVHRFLSEWTTTGARGVPINGWAVMALPDTPLEHQELSDPDLPPRRHCRAPMRPVFAPGSAKQALLEAFESFAAKRREEYRQRDELEDDG